MVQNAVYPWIDHVPVQCTVRSRTPSPQKMLSKSQLPSSTNPELTYSFYEDDTVNPPFCGLHVDDLTNLLKLICNTQVNIFHSLMTIWRHIYVHSGKHLSHLTCMFPATVEQGANLPSCFSSCCKQVSFSQSIQCHFLCFLLMMSHLWTFLTKQIMAKSSPFN
jgi:hypothetical protein